MSSVSIRRRLLALLLATVTGIWALAALATWLDAHREADRLLDAHLAQAASLLIAQTGHELLELEVDELLDTQEFGEGVTFQAWSGGTRLVVKSKDAPGVRLSTLDRGFADTEAGGRRWRVFTARSREHDLLIEVAEDHAVRERIAARIAVNTLVPLVLALPVLALLIWLSVGRALRPLGELGEQLRARQPLALDPLDLPKAPLEVQPLLERLNELFARIRRSSELERRFTADAAHELRKPVAAAKAQAEVARTTPDPGTRAHALDRVVEACDRMAALLTQLLTLARLDQDRPPGGGGRHDLAAIARSAIADLASASVEGLASVVGLEASGDTRVTGEPELLAVLVRNLVTNALRHGGVGVRVAIEGDASGVTLRVTDEGPGVPPAELARLGQRFFRGESARGPGSGLGLSIVRRIADLHGATLTFAAGPTGRGFEACVNFTISHL